MHRFDLTLPRHGFGPRETARPGEIWRTLQDVAVQASSRAGYTPRDYREQQISWVMRTMTVRHLREIQFGDDVLAETWISTFEREIFSNRQIRLSTSEGPLVVTDQRWVHVRLPDLRPTRASEQLQAALGDLGPKLVLDVPTVATPIVDGPTYTFTFSLWHSTMDPLAHANHPAYVDWIEEAWLRWVASKGLDPQQSLAIAESVTYRAAVSAPDVVTVTLTLTGLTADGAAYLDAGITSGDRVMASAWVIRGHHAPAGNWPSILG